MESLTAAVVADQRRKNGFSKEHGLSAGRDQQRVDDLATARVTDEHPLAAGD